MAYERKKETPGLTGFWTSEMLIQNTVCCWWLAQGSPAWCPHGLLVAFASNRTENPDGNSSSNIWVRSQSDRLLVVGLFNLPSFTHGRLFKTRPQFEFLPLKVSCASQVVAADNTDEGATLVQVTPHKQKCHVAQYQWLLRSGWSVPIGHCAER